MLIYVGITDFNWFNLLKNQNPVEINFWQPSSSRNFNAIHPGEVFLFKLHSPNDYIVGGGIFTRQTMLPLSLTWEAFGINNGVNSMQEFLERIHKYRRTDRRSEPDPIISSLILTSPFFLNEAHWIPAPESWSSNIVQGKTYDTNTPEGLIIFDAIQGRLHQEHINNFASRYGKPTIITPRLGQGSFRLVVTEAYHKRCAITGEKTIPVLDAAHIKPYVENGPHSLENGLLLRQDFHTLFDKGYITISEGNIIEVSRRIKEEFGNGKEYYEYHGKQIINLPDNLFERPSREYLLWHNENIFIG